MPLAFHRITEHLKALYKAYVEALECQQRGDGAGAVAALLKAGRLEEAGGRRTQARAWYEVALGVSEALHLRRPEIESLRSLGQLCVTLGGYTEGARHFQRALALAEAEFDQAAAIAACEGMGDLALAQGQWTGAQAWYARGQRLAEASADPRSIGRLERQHGVLARRLGDLAAAGDHLRRARECFESVGAADEMARVLNTQGQLEAQEEMRRAEQVAIAGNATLRLVQVYTLMGKLRCQQQDETGFVFFEQAIELCRMIERSPTMEAQVYLEYGLFRERLGQREEARAYLERAKEIFDSLGEAVERARVEAELQKVT